ncbi:CPBP family intramembrane metalloprotease [Neobacillus notoginsengisoli]|uniref:CPBP family intramembrane metalloprotease n=1 Tax=Neobacillus notoginsengisoli TaxID=1578198 RepID=A0A417YVF5_9BACI|nr:type II CAAX endopeptidase family protein [Neobacillus notoginsengisoli]RHW41218.1 CPBP family intramembrane metalloprotease [Neobacillus notoginsengisoli]
MKNKHKELIGQLTDKELLFHLYATQLFLLAISLVLSMVLPGKTRILGLFDWGDKAVITIGIPAGLAIVILDLILMKILPPSYFDDGGLNDKIFSGRSLPHIVFIAGVVAVSEEILFRGIIQEKTGLFIASIIFAVIHYRYLFNWFLFLNIVVLSFFIGAIYYWTGNLAVTVTMHFVIDCFLGMILKVKNGKGGLGNES